MRESKGQDLARTEKQSRLVRVGAVILGTLVMTWPALYNGFPLIYPDSMTYVEDGLPVARAVLLHKLSDYYGMRSLIYSLGILPWHWNVTVWPVIGLQALLTAYVIWLVVRSFAPRRVVTSYLVLAAALSACTSASWFVSLVLPDILGAVLYLCIYLMVFARETLSRFERIAVAAIAWWAITSHATHLMLAAGLCILLALLLAVRREFMRGRLRAVSEVALIILLAAGAQVALNAYLTGEPSLNGDRPPFLMARVIADGPGRWYAEQHCPQVNLAICGFVNDLPDDSDEFIWGDKGVWQSADDETKDRLLREEIPFVEATFRAYPRAVLSKTAASFWGQLTDFGVDDLGPNDWVLSEFDHVLPSGRARYLQSRQARDALPLELFSKVFIWVVVVSLVTLLVFAALLWRKWTVHLVGLSVVIASMVVANAFVTGALSTVEDRYESRVIWLVPFLAGIVVMEWAGGRRGSRAPTETVLR